MNIEKIEEVIEKLQHIEDVYKEDLPEEYIDRIREIWCDMQNEIEIEEETEEKIEEYPSYGYDYNKYLWEIR